VQPFSGNFIRIPAQGSSVLVSVCLSCHSFVGYGLSLNKVRQLEDQHLCEPVLRAGKRPSQSEPALRRAA
jgi:hypothetical protein